MNIFARASTCSHVKIGFYVHPENFTSAFLYNVSLKEKENNIDNSDDLKAVTSIHSRHINGCYSTNNSVNIQVEILFCNNPTKKPNPLKSLKHYEKYKSGAVTYSCIVFCHQRMWIVSTHTMSFLCLCILCKQ